MFTQLQNFLKGPSFLRSDHALTADDAARVERRLAIARIVLAVCAVVAVRLDPLEPARYATFTAGLLTLYAAYSVLVFALLPLHARDPRYSAWVVHPLDFIWPALLTTFSSGPNSPLFVMFLFGLMAAAYRWGFFATMMSCAVAALTLVSEAAILSVSPQLIEGQFELNRFIIRSIYLLVTGVLLGYLAEDEKRVRAEVSAISRAVSKLSAQRSLRSNLGSVFEELLRMYAAPRALFAARETKTGRLFLWRANRAESASSDLILHLSEADAGKADEFLFMPEWHAWQAQGASGAGGMIELNAAGRRVRPPRPLPPEFLSAQSFQSAIGISFTIDNDWRGALFLFDAAPGGPPENTLRFLQLLMRRVSAVAFNVYLLRRLRSRAGAIERARVARDLHDGILQSLIALEMQVDVLRRNEAGRLDADLAPLQKLLHNEILSVRELMYAMRPVELEPRQFLDFAADTVQRFERETGITARFISELDDVWLSPRAARELARVLQEALVNVRKHSGARNVLVRFGSKGGRWTLSVDDDGRGFEFEGRLDHNQLEQNRRGPAIIKERLRGIQGELAIESRPGQGARLEISVPQKAYG